MYKHFDFGPLNSVEADTEMCAESYWKNLLYVTNLENVGITSPLEAVSNQNSPKIHPVTGDKFIIQYLPCHLQCVAQSWYMSAEMQMFLFSPFLLVPTWYINEYFGGLFAIGFSSLFAVGLTIDVLVEAHNKQWPPSFGT